MLGMDKGSQPTPNKLIKPTAPNSIETATPIHQITASFHFTKAIKNSEKTK